MVETLSAQTTDLLREYLKVEWLRPESALCRAVSAYVLQRSEHAIEQPSLDVGAGTGWFGFIAAGGSLSVDYDMFQNAGNLEMFWQGGDIYDHFAEAAGPSMIVRRPRWVFDCALDHKDNLRKQAAFLGFYRDYRIGDANDRWPFEDGQFKSVFSNMLYWLADPAHCVGELSRVLTRSGKAHVFLQNPSFTASCPTYRSREFPGYEELLETLNHARAACHRWQVTDGQLEALAAEHGLEILERRRCLSPLVLRIWDIGLRPLSPILIKIVNALTPDARRALKQEWVDTCWRLLSPIFMRERACAEGGYTFCVLQKR